MAQLLASRLGTTAHLSPLLHKAKRLGLGCPEYLEHVAVARGLGYFGRLPSSAGGRESEFGPSLPDPDQFSNEELAIALMSPALPYSIIPLRMAAGMLGADAISVDKILRLARQERCETIVRYIAECAFRVEPEHPLWTSLMEKLPPVPSLAPDILPHPSRFVAMSGITRAGRQTSAIWIRPLH